jgi:hypothetical protein
MVLLVKFLFASILFFIGHKRPPESGSVNLDPQILIRKKYIYGSPTDCQLGYLQRFKNLGHLKR